MRKFTYMSAVAAPLPLANIDTDMIIPAQYMKALTRKGLGVHLFHDARYHADGSECADFILNHPLCRNAQILLTDRNFACGSSREHAAWALTDFGIYCVIAPSFGDIFASNARKNGLLLITLPDEICRRLRAAVEQSDYAPISIDLTAQEIIIPSSEIITFCIDPTDRDILLNGLDDIERSLKHLAAIERFEDAA